MSMCTKSILKFDSFSCENIRKLFGVAALQLSGKFEAVFGHALLGEADTVTGRYRGDGPSERSDVTEESPEESHDHSRRQWTQVAHPQCRRHKR